MNKKGFTLIELLAVIVILGIVMLIGTVSVTGVQRKINKSMFETKLELAVGAAKSWGQDNKEQLTSNLSFGGATYKGKTITIDKLIASGFLTTEEKVPTSEYSACDSSNKINGNCLVIKNNMDDTIVNNLVITVYLQYNRVYACIQKSDDNRRVLGEDDSWSVFGDLKYYCS